jgi:hypothetical protein
MHTRIIVTGAAIVVAVVIGVIAWLIMSHHDDGRRM